MGLGVRVEGFDDDAQQETKRQSRYATYTADTARDIHSRVPAAVSADTAVTAATYEEHTHGAHLETGTVCKRDTQHARQETRLQQA